MSGNLPSKILVVDDDESVINQLEKLVSSYNVYIEKCPTLNKALYYFNQKLFDAAIIEMEFEELPGTVIAQKFRENENPIKRNTPLIISMGIKRNRSEAALITELGDVTLLSKPFSTGGVLKALTQAKQIGKNRARLEEVLNKVVKPLLMQGKLEKAIKISEQKLLPLGEKGMFETSLIMEEAKQYDMAINLLNELCVKYQSNMKYINALARLYTSLGDFAKAKIFYEKADKIAPENLNRLTEMAGLYLALKEPVKSVEKYTKLLSLNPEKPEMKFQVYQEIFDSGFEEHARDLCRSTSTPLELIRHFNNKGVLCSKQQKYEEAIAEYRKARDLIPLSKDLYKIIYNMAIANINLKKRENVEIAHELLEEVLELKPNFQKAIEKIKMTTKALGIDTEQSAS